VSAKAAGAWLRMTQSLRIFTSPRTLGCKCSVGRLMHQRIHPSLSIRERDVAACCAYSCLFRAACGTSRALRVSPNNLTISATYSRAERSHPFFFFLLLLLLLLLLLPLSVRACYRQVPASKVLSVSITLGKKKKKKLSRLLGLDQNPAHVPF